MSETEAPAGGSEGGFFDRRENDLLLIGAVLAVIYLVYAGIAVLLDLRVAGTLIDLTRWIGLFAIVTLALNLHWGYTGLFNIGVVGFMGVGVYATAVASKPVATDAAAGATGGFGLPLWLGVIIGGIVAGLFGLVIALPALRLRADYLAIVTVAVSEILRFVFRNRSLANFNIGGQSVGLGGGDGLQLDWGSEAELLLDALFLGSVYDGLVSTLEGSVAGNPEAIADGIIYSLILVAFVVGYYLLLGRMANSPFGRVLKAIREDEEAAGSLGKDTARFKLIVFMIGCGLMGVAGVVWFMNAGGQGTINSTQFRPELTFYVWIALIIGGAGSNTGSVLGGAIFAAVLFQGPRFLQDIIREFVNLQQAPLGDVPGSFGAAMAPISGSLDVVPLLLYTASRISDMQLLIMGLVLIWLMHNRPDGLLGHRKEHAAAVSLDRPEKTSSKGFALTTDGGTTDAEAADGDATDGGQTDE